MTKPGRKYVPKPKVTRECACGCGEIFETAYPHQHFIPEHRLAYQRRRRVEGGQMFDLKIRRRQQSRSRRKAPRAQVGARVLELVERAREELGWDGKPQQIIERALQATLDSR